MSGFGALNPAAGDLAPVLLLGATGQVGSLLLEKLLAANVPVMAVSRRVPERADMGVTWLQHDLRRERARVQAHVLASCGPLKLALRQAEFMPRLERVVALSSASVLFKHDSDDPDERALINELIDTERRFEALAEKRGFGLVLLRPTLIYGGPGPSALDPVRAWLARHRWAPIAGHGLRQPVHAEDLAELIVGLLARPPEGIMTVALGGGESLPYPEFVRRIASGAGRNPRLVRLPTALLGAGLRIAHRFGIARAIGPAMVRRQRMDLVVDDQPARRQLGWNPRAFRP